MRLASAICTKRIFYISGSQVFYARQLDYLILNNVRNTGDKNRIPI